MGIVLVYAAYRLIALKSKSEAHSIKDVPIAPTMPWVAVIGLLSGLTRVGGGIFLSPLLLLMG